MGQKVNPNGIRLGIVRDHESKWYASRLEYADTLIKDLQVRKYLESKTKAADVSKIDLKLTGRNAEITLHAARPGIIIGRKGQDVEKLRARATEIMGLPVHINIEEVRKPELEARLVAKSIADQLERRVMFRRAMKRAVQNAMKSGAEGIKVNVSGRLGGAEIARNEWYREGRVPLHTLRADVDYGVAEAKTTYGIIGIKVWIFKGEVLDHKTAHVPAEAPEAAAATK